MKQVNILSPYSCSRLCSVDASCSWFTFPILINLTWFPLQSSASLLFAGNFLKPEQKCPLLSSVQTKWIVGGSTSEFEGTSTNVFSVNAVSL